jgi:Na+-driven multidrug efflux pump
MWATMAGMWGIRVPLAFIAAVWLMIDVWYVWSAMIVDWTVRMALLLWRYRSERWQAIRVFSTSGPA